MKGPGGYEALRGSLDLRSAQAADGHRRIATIEVAGNTPNG
jgi:hypothetical protein